METLEAKYWPFYGVKLRYDFDCWLCNAPAEGVELSFTDKLEEVWSHPLDEGRELAARRCGVVGIRAVTNVSMHHATTVEGMDIGIRERAELARLCNVFIYCLTIAIRETGENPGAFAVSQSDILIMNGYGFSGSRPAMKELSQTLSQWMSLNGELPRSALDRGARLSSQFLRVPGMQDLVSLMNQASSAYVEYDFALALTTAWTILEKRMNMTLAAQGESPSGTAYQTSRRLLELGLVDEETLEEVDHARRARNDWAHEVVQPDRATAGRALTVASTFLHTVIGDSLPPASTNIGLRG